MADWIKALTGFSQEQIEAGCSDYIRTQPRKRPTPADVRSRIRTVQPGLYSDKKAGLSRDELGTLETKVLPTAREWVRKYPDGSVLHRHGMNTLEHWGER